MVEIFKLAKDIQIKDLLVSKLHLTKENEMLIKKKSSIIFKIAVRIFPKIHILL